MTDPAPSDDALEILPPRFAAMLKVFAMTILGTVIGCGLAWMFFRMVDPDHRAEGALPALMMIGGIPCAIMGTVFGATDVIVTEVRALRKTLASREKSREPSATHIKPAP